MCFIVVANINWADAYELIGVKEESWCVPPELTFTFHLADAFIQSDFQERALQKRIGH